MRELKLNNSKLVALIDDEDYNRSLGYLWDIGNNRLSIRRAISLNGQTKHIPLSNFIMNKFDCIFDHKDRNPLNNQKINLRECSIYQNMANKAKVGINATSKYKGVYIHDIKRKVWRARITHKKKTYCLGLYKNEDDAALAYNKAALNLLGEFAFQNTISPNTLEDKQKTMAGNQLPI